MSQKKSHLRHDVPACPSCGKPHPQLKFFPLVRRQGPSNYFANCPDSGEPFMATVTVLLTGMSDAAVPANHSPE